MPRNKDGTPIVLSPEETIECVQAINRFKSLSWEEKFAELDAAMPQQPKPEEPEETSLSYEDTLGAVIEESTAVLDGLYKTLDMHPTQVDTPTIDRHHYHSQDTTNFLTHLSALAS